MNQSKIKYLRTRVDDAYNEKRAAIDLSYRKKTLTPANKLEALKQGKFAIREDVSRTYGHSIDDFIIFEGFPDPDLKERDVKLAELLKKKTELLDEIVLGDEENALQLLRGFAGE